MQLGFESLKGLDRDRIISVVEPVLRAHAVDAVELIWRSDQRGWLLYLTVETVSTEETAAGVTLDLCADISRDLSAALDVAEAIAAPRYRLEVGSPGIERALYQIRDYARFAGQQAKVKIRQPIDGQRVLQGLLKGLNETGNVVLVVEGVEHVLPPSQIENGRLWFDWQAARGVQRTEGGQRPRGRAAQRDR